MFGCTLLVIVFAIKHGASFIVSWLIELSSVAERASDNQRL